MDITSALDALGARDDLLTEQNRNDLDEKGYTVLPGIIDAEWLVRRCAPALRNCARKKGATPVLKFIRNRVRAASPTSATRGRSLTASILTPRCWPLSTTSSVAPSSSLRSMPVTPYPARGYRGCTPTGAQTTTASFTSATRSGCWTLSARKTAALGWCPARTRVSIRAMPLADAQAPHPDEELLIAPAGTVAVFNSHMWHGGTCNQSKDLPRRAMHCYFTAREHGQQLNQREYLRYETWKRISPAARYILDVDVE